LATTAFGNSISAAFAAGSTAGDEATDALLDAAFVTGLARDFDGADFAATGFAAGLAGLELFELVFAVAGAVFTAGLAAAVFAVGLTVALAT
jgi:hypothetical protein